MTKREGIDSLTRVKKPLKELETHHGEILLNKTNFRQRARKDRKKADDIIRLIKEADKISA
jgi:hypothetical protein